MSTFAEYTNEYLNKKKKQTYNGTSFEDYTRSVLGDDAYEKETTTKTVKGLLGLDIPDGTSVSISPVPFDDPEEDERSWFEAGAFDDGYQFGDVLKTIWGSARDVADNAFAGILGMGESIVDAGAYVVGAVGGLFSEDFQEDTQEFIAQDLYDEEEIARTILNVADPITGIFNLDNEANSVFGEKTDSLVQSGGQLLGTIGLQAVGVPWFVTSGVTSFGSGVENAFNQGATYGEAGLSGAINAGAEILTEKLFGGSGLGEKGLINLDGLTKGISGKAVKALADLGVDMAAEGSEEFVSQVISNLGSALYREENLGDILFSEEAVDGYIESFIGGSVLGGVMNTGNSINSIKTGRDYRTGLTANEQKVFDAVYNERLAEAEKSGAELTKKEKAAIYDGVMNDLQKGGISSDKIESILGEESYKAYQDTVANEDAILKEFSELGKMKKSDFTAEQDDRYTELKQLVADINKGNARTDLKTKLSTDVQNMLTETNSKGEVTRSDNYLIESYNEKSRRGQTFEADLTKYKGNQQEIVKKAIESGILNNTNRTHEFVDMIAKISADKGVLFDFTNNEKLKNSGFAVDGAAVNGYITKDGVTVNIDSQKSLNSIVGHEITHVLEGTEIYAELQKALFEYAKTKKAYDGRRKALEDLYKNIKDANVDAELTADLVGDYLFTDSDFVNNLSTKHRNVFQKIYDEIKYLLKVTTAGSKEARELERVKRAFDKAYKESGKASGDTKYSVSERVFYTPRGVEVVQNPTSAEYRQMREEIYKDYPNLRGTGEAILRHTYDESGNVYYWNAYNGMHRDVEPYINERYNTRTSQQWEWWTREDKDDYPTDYTKTRYSLPEDAKKADTDYLDAVNRGDMETAQKMVDDAAEEWSAGKRLYTTDADTGEVLYTFYRSADGGRTVWNGHGQNRNNGVFLTSDEYIANAFDSARGSTTGGGKHISVYAKAENPFEIDAMGQIYTAIPVHEDSAPDWLYEMSDSYTEWSDQANDYVAVDCVDIDNLYPEAFKRGYDAVIVKNVKEGVGGGLATDIVLKDGGKQMKSAEAVTYYDNGKVIPLSERFNAKNDDIRYSLSDSDGKQLTKEQSEYFKDSKMRDENGNLKVMYHGSQDAGFHVFDPSMSDDDTSFFFVDRNDVAASYSGTTENYEAQTIRNAEDMNNFIESIGAEGYEVIEKDGKFTLLYEGDRVADSNTAQGIYEEFCWYEGVGEGDANYKVYLNLTNPLEVDAEGRNWNNITREFSQNIADRYNSLTAEEKAALSNLAEWGEYSIFKDEMLDARAAAEQGVSSGYGDVAFTKTLARAYQKLGGANANLYDAFSIASDNFSAESIQEFAVKQMNTRDYAQKAKAEGYDGVIFKNIVDVGGYGNGSEGASTVAIAFDSNQIKSVANEKPTRNADIRYSLSEDSEGRKLSDEQKQYFNGSKVVDDNGNLKVVYHGSPVDFNTFSLKYLGTNGTNEGYGFYFTDSKQIAEGYTKGLEGQRDDQHSGKLFEVYLDIKKPLSDTEITIPRAQFRKFLIELNNQVDADGEPLDILSNYGDVSWEGLNKVLNTALETEYNFSANDVDMICSVINMCGDKETVFNVLRKVTGHDGIIVKEASWGGDQTIYLAFHPEQIKNVTNQSPTTNPDIRRSLSFNGEAPIKRGNFNISGDDVRLEAPVQENVAPEVEAVPKMETTTEDFAPITEEEANALQSETIDTLTDADAPPEMEAPYYGEDEDIAPADPFENRDIKEVGSRKVKAYMYENPEVKPFFQKEANIMLGELRDTTKGERFYTPMEDGVPGEYGAESYGVWTGTSRHTTQDIEYLLDELGYSYAEIEKGLNAIIKDDGAENNACSKRIEFILNERLMGGYLTIDGYEIPADQDYINLLQEKQITEYSEEARKSFFDVADAFAPVADDIDTVAEKHEAIKPESTKEPKLIKVKDGEDIAPTATYETAKAGQINGQRTMFEEGKTAEVYDAEPENAKKKARGWAKFRTNFLDKQSVFEDLALKTKNRELMGKANHMLSSESRAQWMIGHGADGVKSLNDIRAEVEKTGKTKQFYEYMYHKHNVDRMSLESNAAPVSEGLRSKFGHLKIEQIKAIAAKEITDKTTEKTAATIRDAREYLKAIETKNKPVFGDSVTAEVSKQIAQQYEAENPQFKEYAKDVYAYMEHLRGKLVESGVISQDTANLWANMYPNYVPIRRLGDSGLNINVPLDTGKTGVNAPIKRAKGGNRDILPLFDTMALRTEQTFKAIAKNNFGVELKNTLGTTIESTETNLDEVIDNIDNHEGLLKKGENGANPTFTVFENGERVTFEISEDMYDALKPTSDGLRYTNKIANTASNLHRGILTEYNPVFMATNAIKDVQDVLINSQHAAKTYANIPTAIKDMATNGKWYKEYLENGGERNTYFDGQTNTFTKEDKGIKKLIGMPLRAIQRANNFVERAPRLAEYIASRKAGASVEVAMLDAARVTTNFAAGGDVTKFLNRNGATFLNASVQGFNQQVRNIREAKANGLKGWVHLATKAAIAGFAPMLLNNMLWDDDEEYAELSDYVKQNYYVVAKFGDGQFVRIPKGRTLAVIQSALEQTVNAATGNDEVDLQSFLELAISNLAPNNPIDNNIFAPIMQVMNNETWYGEDLVPTRLQDLPAAEQYDESTDSISKWLGEKLNISPYKINYLLDQYSGGVGDVLLPMLTPEAESGDNSLAGNLLAPLKDKFTTDSVMNNQNVSDFYDTVDELTTNAKSSYATDEDVLKSKYMNSINAQLSELYQVKREIQNSNLSDAEKYEEVRDIQKEIDALAKNALNTYNNVYISDGYARVGDLHYRWYEPGEGSDAEPGWQKITDKQLEKMEDVTDALRIDPSEYWGNKSEYDFAYEYPEKYAVAKSVGGYERYKTYSSELYDIKADKDENGKSISGSRKEKVIDYINNLDADYGEKIILFKSEYNADDTYNYDIIDYLNSREDISYEEMESILKELGFNVSSDGTITW